MTFLPLRSILVIRLYSLSLFLPLILQVFFIFIVASAKVCSLVLVDDINLILRILGKFSVFLCTG